MPETSEGMLSKLIGRLAQRQLMWICGVLFVVNIFVPDPIPIVDELLLGGLTLLLARWRSGSGPQPPVGEADKPPMKDVTPK